MILFVEKTNFATYWSGLDISLLCDNARPVLFLQILARLCDDGSLNKRMLIELKQSVKFKY